MTISIRPVLRSDIPAMAAIRAREWETETYWMARIENYLSGKLSPRHALAARAAFVATEGTTVVGFVSGHRTQRFGCDGELEWIDVIEEHRGRGIAGKLLQQMAGWFVQQDALRICVDVDPNNLPAQRLYAK